MVSNQVLQNTIEGIKEISHLELGVMDSDGREVAVTAPVFANAAAAIPDFANSPADSQSAGPYQFFKVMDEQQLEYVIVVYGETDSSLLIGRMAAVMLGSSETSFYVIAVYFSAAGAKDNGRALPAALCADLACFLGAAWICRLLWG